MVEAGQFGTGLPFALAELGVHRLSGRDIAAGDVPRKAASPADDRFRQMVAVKAPRCMSRNRFVLFMSLPPKKGAGMNPAHALSGCLLFGLRELLVRERNAPGSASLASVRRSSRPKLLVRFQPSPSL